MKKIFFFILCISKFLVGSNACLFSVEIKEKPEDIIRRHLYRISQRESKKASFNECFSKRGEELVRPEYLKNIISSSLQKTLLEKEALLQAEREALLQIQASELWNKLQGQTEEKKDSIINLYLQDVKSTELFRRFNYKFLKDIRLKVLDTDFSIEKSKFEVDVAKLFIDLLKLNKNK